MTRQETWKATHWARIPTGGEERQHLCTSRQDKTTQDKTKNIESYSLRGKFLNVGEGSNLFKPLDKTRQDKNMESHSLDEYPDWT
jgi:hypothetical protein